MSLIRILNEKVVAQIAAGEVIDRPASVVRELVDNSIDAAADRIHLMIQTGGKRLIKVSDNGVGMNRDDLLLCIERHATSKISAVSDLYSVRSMGFRGEALASISAVSRMEIISRPHDQLIGCRLRVAGGSIKSMEEIGSPSGTIVEVRDLFFNIPVRRKFLKTERTEADHIVDMVARMALPFIEIDFRLDEGDKVLLNLAKSEHELSRLPVIFGRNTAATMSELSDVSGEFKVRIFLGHPDQSRTRGDRVLFYVNRRHIRERSLMHAVMEGYGQRLMKGRFPEAVILMEIDPAQVDVNVHPTKQEIRLHQNRHIHENLISVIRKALGPKYYPSGLESGANAEEHAPAPVVSERPVAYEAADNRPQILKKHPQQEDSLFEKNLQILGQLRDTYILCEASDGFLMIDQHAAHERLVYERLRKSYKSARVESQPFLIPPRLEFSFKDAQILLRAIDQLGRLGLEIEHFGGSTFLLRSVPSVLTKARWETFFADLIPLIEEGGEVGSEEVFDKYAIVMACHGAIRAGQTLSMEEMGFLLKELENADLPTNCPHGRPVSRKFSYDEIERMFRRAV